MGTGGKNGDRMTLQRMMEKKEMRPQTAGQQKTARKNQPIDSNDRGGAARRGAQNSLEFKKGIK